MLLTQEEFASMLGVSYATVNRWENGHFEPTMKTKRKLDGIIRNFSNKGYKTNEN